MNKPQNYKLMNFYNNDLEEGDADHQGEEPNDDGLSEHTNWAMPRQIFSDSHRPLMN